MTNRRTLRVALGGSLLLAALGCTPHAGSNAPEPSTGAAPQHSSEQLLLELFSWWTAPGEAEALQALVESHKQSHPNARVFNAAAASGTKSREILADRFARNQPPDMFQQNAHDVRAFLEKYPNQLMPLEGLFEQLDLKRSVYAEVIRDVTLDGHIYAMPVNIHRENTLLYNQSVFAAHGITPPTTFDEFLQICEQLKQQGVTPLATSHQGWILRIMFNSIAMGKMGAVRYHQYFTGQLPANDPTFRAAIDAFAEVLENYTNADAGEDGFGWTNAAQAVYNGDAAMFMHGDWAKGYFVQLGWKPGVHFGAIGAPGAAEMFLYGVDVFSVPRGAPNQTGARQFLSTIASSNGQVAFNNVKGSSPIRFDIAESELDAVGRATANDLEHAQTRMLVRGREAWDNALADFAKSKDRETLFQTYVNNPPQH